MDRGNELAWADLGSHFSDGRGRQTAERTHTHNLKQDVGVRYVCTYDVCEVTPRRAGMERSAEQRHDHQTRPTRLCIIYVRVLQACGAPQQNLPRVVDGFALRTVLAQVTTIHSVFDLSFFPSTASGIGSYPWSSLSAFLPSFIPSTTNRNPWPSIPRLESERTVVERWRAGGAGGAGRELESPISQHGPVSADIIYST